MRKDVRETFREIANRVEEHEFYTDFPKGYRRGRTKFVIVTGSVISGVGKGTFTSCLGTLLKLAHGLSVSPVKLEGYLNYDSGTLNPFRHGEVFVLDDGTECDLDLGTYERMLNQDLSRDNFLTAGRLFKTIIDKERAGGYLGRDVQFIPHVTGELKNFLRNLAMKSKADVLLVEIGGTVGDIENSYYMEAMRELGYEEGKENVCFINVVYILEPGSLGEQKSKAAQLGLRTLMGLGIQPDIVVCRSENPIRDSIKEKISIVSNIPVSRVVNIHDTRNIYRVPLQMKEMGIDRAILEILKTRGRNPSRDLSRWEKLSRSAVSARKRVVIGIAGKYTNVHDSYLSILKALEHTSPYLDARVDVRWIDTGKINRKNVGKEMRELDGLIIPGGFGARGVAGKIECIRYARENGIPFLGLCFGFQLAVVEFARNVCGLGEANSTEIESDAKEPVICILPEQEEIEGLGGTMRLGGHDVMIKKGTGAHRIHGKTSIRRRFRHRWNLNTRYIDALEKKGMVFSGFAPQKRIMQILELPEHPFFFATQYHPELTSKPLEPEPLFRELIKSALKHRSKK